MSNGLPSMQRRIVRRRSFVAVMVVMAIGLTSCLPSERQVSSVVDNGGDRGRNSGFFSLDGVGTGLAMNALTMGLEKLGVPSEVLAIFGGGSDNSAVLAALARIEESLRQINQKLDFLIGEVAVLSQDVSNLSTALQHLNGEICGTRSEVLRANLRELQDISLRGWDDLFSQSSGIVSIGINAIKSAPDRNARAAADAALMNRLIPFFEDLNRNDSYARGQAKFNDFLLDSVDGAPGLIAVMQKCTLAEQRFISATTTKKWRSYVQLMVVLEARLLAIKVLGQSVGERTLLQDAADGKISQSQLSAGLSASLDRRIRAALDFVDGASRQLFMVGKDVPADSFLDTVTMKMWTVESRVGGLDALLARGISNDYPALAWPGESPTPVRRPTRLGVTDIDSAASTQLDRTLWRVPDLYELTAGVPGSNAGSRPAWADDSLPGLLGGGGNSSGTVFPAWSQASSTDQVDCRNKCVSPVAYLKSQGVDVNLSDVGQIWTNTSRAAMDLSSRSRTNAKIARNRELYETTARTKMVHVSGWAMRQNPKMACAKFPDDYLNGGIEAMGWNSRCADETTAWSIPYTPECSHLEAGEPLNEYGAEMMMLNMIPDPRGASAKDSGRKFYVPDAGAAFVGLARNGPINTSGHSYLSISCQRQDSSCNWLGECSYSYSVTFASQITTWADDTLLVRNLNDDEAYFFTDPLRTARLLSAHQRPSLVVATVATTKGSLIELGVRRPTTSRDLIELRCLVDPDVAVEKEYTPSGRIGNISWSGSPIRYTDEELWARLPVGAAGNGCTANQIYDVTPGSSLAGVRLSEGKHTVYAMARVEVNGVSRYTELVVSDFDNVKGPPQRPSAPIVNAVSSGRVVVSVPPPGSDVFVQRYTVRSSTGKTCSYGAGDTTCTISVDNAEWGRDVTFTGSITTAGGVSVASDASEPVLIDHVPAPPELSISEVGDGYVVVSGRRNTTVSGGRIQKIEVGETSGSAGCTILGESGTCRVNNLQNELGHSFTGVAANGLGRSAQSVQTDIAYPKKSPLVPGAPLVQVGISSAFITGVAAKVDLSAGGSPDSYEFTSNPDGATCTAAAKEPFCVVSGLRNNVSYTFTAVAINSGGRSAASAMSTQATPLPLPGGPKYSVVEGDRSLTFKFAEVAAGSTDKSCDGTCGPTESFVVNVFPSSTDRFGWTLRQLHPEEATNTAKCTATVATRSCTIGGLTNGVFYRVYARSVNSVGFTNAPITQNSLAAPFGVKGVPSVVLYPRNGTISAVVPAPELDNGATGYVPFWHIEMTLSPGDRKCVTTADGFVSPDYIRSVYKGTTAATEAFKAAVCDFNGLTNGVAYTATAIAFSCRTGVQPCERQNDSARSDESAPAVPVGRPTTPRIVATTGDNKVTFRLAEPISSYGADRVIVYSDRELSKWADWQATSGRSSVPFPACVITRNQPTCEVGVNAKVDAEIPAIGWTQDKNDLNGHTWGYFAGAENVAGFSLASDVVSVEPLGRPWNTWFTVEPGNESVVVTMSADANKMPPNPTWAAGSGNRPMQLTARVARLGTSCTVDVSNVLMNEDGTGWYGLAESDPVTGRWKRFGCAIENLRNDVEYTIEVTATNGSGQTKSSIVAKARPYESTGVPDTPTITDVSFVRGQFQVSAGRAARGGIPESIKVEAECVGECGGVNPTVAPNCSISVTASRCNIVPSTAGTDSYRFRVQAINRDGNSTWSAWSANYGFPAPPTTPDSPIVTVKQGRATVQIFPGQSESAGPADRFIVRLDSVSGDDSAPRQCSISSTDDSLQCSVSIRSDVEYTAVVSALNYSGTSLPSQPSERFASITRPSKPVIASALAGDKSVAVEVKAGIGGGRPSSYVVVARPSGRFCQIVAPASACIIEKLVADGAYVIEVSAVNSVGQSDPSDTSVVNVSTRPEPASTGPKDASSGTTTPSPPTTHGDATPLPSASTSPQSIGSSSTVVARIPASPVAGLGTVNALSVGPPTLEVGKPIRVGRIPEFVGQVGLGKAPIIAKIPKTSRKVCKAVKNTIQGTRPGSCSITLVVTNKPSGRGRITMINLTISIVD